MNLYHVLFIAAGFLTALTTFFLIQYLTIIPQGASGIDWECGRTSYGYSMHRENGTIWQGYNYCDNNTGKWVEGEQNNIGQMITTKPYGNNTIVITYFEFDNDFREFWPERVLNTIANYTDSGYDLKTKTLKGQSQNYEIYEVIMVKNVEASQ